MILLLVLISTLAFVGIAVHYAGISGSMSGIGKALLLSVLYLVFFGFLASTFRKKRHTPTKDAMPS